MPTLAAMVDEHGDGGWRAGVRVGAAFAISAFALAVSFGTLARAQGWDPSTAVVFSAVAFSGSAQYAVLSVLGSGGPLAAIGSAALMNARFLPMGSAVSASLRGGRWRRGLEGQAVVDGSWAAAYRGDGRFDRGTLMAATAVQWPAWVAGTALGAYLAPPVEVLDRFALDVVFPAFFALLLLDAVRKSPSGGRVALVAAAIGAAVVLAAPAGVALVASSVASLVVLVRRPDEARP